MAIASRSKLSATAIDVLRRVLLGERLADPDDAFTCVRSFPHGHVAAVLGTVQQFGLNTLIARGAGRFRDLVVAMVVARVIGIRGRSWPPSRAGSRSAVWLVERQVGIEQRLAKSIFESTRWCSTT